MTTSSTRFARTFALSAVAVLPLLFAISPASACKCDPQRSQEYALTAALVGEAEVVSGPTAKANPAEATAPGQVWKVKILRVDRGDQALTGKTIDMDTGPGTCAASFPPKGAFPLAAERFPGVGGYATGSCLQFGLMEALKNGKPQ